MRKEKVLDQTTGNEGLLGKEVLIFKSEKMAIRKHIHAVNNLIFDCLIEVFCILLTITMNFFLNISQSHSHNRSATQVWTL
ncbi:hypothetical protein STEG23_009937 [Scotinomys teguina]